MSQEKEISNHNPNRDTGDDLVGRLLALDPGDKRVGVAISDERHLSLRPLVALRHTNWKKLLLDVKELIREFDAKALIIGLPLSLDGIEKSAALSVRDIARKFALSLEIPIYLQDERLTTVEASESLSADRQYPAGPQYGLDSESAVIILRDFIENPANRIKVKP